MIARLLAGVLALVVVAGVATFQASAKGAPVVARILTPINPRTTAGTRLTVVWTLSQRGEDGTRHPFDVGHVFTRFFGHGDSRSRPSFAKSTTIGWYRASVIVPRGGIKRIVIGWLQITCNIVGCHGSPVFLRIVGDPLGGR